MEEKENRVHRLEIRLTQEEHDQLAATVKEIGIDKSQLVRKLLFRGENTLMVTSRDFRQATDRIGPELGKIGSNINQFARYANSLSKTKQVKPELIEDFNKLLLEYKLANDELIQIFNALMKSKKM